MVQPDAAPVDTGPEHDGPPVLVFLGPSLPLAAATELLPGATFLPPICQGQLLSAVDRHRPDVVGIVDGEFGQSLSVWHKEILHVLGAGVRVLGASSMGALRAAECDVYGMEGVGRIYEWYRDGVLVDDDEVALLHGPAEHDWRSLTWPMVNVRATVELLRERGLVDEPDAEAILSAAKVAYFGNRTEGGLASELATRGRTDGAAFASLVGRHYVDQKRLDAEALLVRLAGDLGPAPGERRVPRQRLSWLGESLRSCDTEVLRPTGPVVRQRIVHDAALHEEDFEALQERALHRSIVATYARELGHEPSDSDVADARARFLRRRDLTEETLPDWLEANDLDDERFARLIADEACTARIRRWFLGTLGYERNTGSVTDQLRLEGRYPDVADRAARRAALSEGRDETLSSDPAANQRLVAEQLGVTSWRPSTPLAEWLDEYGFGSAGELLVALADAAAARREAARRRQRSVDALAAMIGDDA